MTLKTRYTLLSLAFVLAAPFGIGPAYAWQEQKAQQPEEKLPDDAELMAKSEAEAMEYLRSQTPEKLEAEAYLSLQDAMSGRTSQAIALMAARKAAAVHGAEIGEAAIRYQQLGDEWRATEGQLTEAMSENTPGIDVKRENLRKRIAELEAELERIDKLLEERAPDYHALISPRAIAFAKATETLRDDEAAILLIPTSYGTHVMTVSDAGTSWHRSEMDYNAVRDAVNLLRRDLDPGGADLRAGGAESEAIASGLAPYDRKTAWKLYQELIMPMVASLQGKTHLYIAADGPLSALPFSVLVSAEPVGDDADPETLRSTRWFGDDFALVQLPTLQSLAMLRSRERKGRKQSPSASFEGFGNPALQGQSVQRGRGAGGSIAVDDIFTIGRTRSGGGIANVESLRKMAQLPGTEIELQNIANALGASRESLHLGREATETRVRNTDLSKDRIIAFATHGLLAGEVGGINEPGLVFTPPETPTEDDDGLLSAAEVTTLSLNADWVILSACNTAAGEDGHSDGLSGLARAFFYAGADSLLASHWPVRDDVAARITVDAIKLQLEDGEISKAKALQNAMQQIRNDRKDDTLAHPSSWAPFVLVGEGR